MPSAPRFILLSSRATQTGAGMSRGGGLGWFRLLCQEAADAMDELSGA
jgi:hypothetical protein